VKAISQRASGGWSPKKMAAFFAVFLVTGLAFLLVFLLPAIKVLRAQGWEAVDCEILESRVATASGGDTFSIEVRYRYEFGGQSYEGDRYEFMGGSSSGYDDKREVVDAMPAGSATTCYVDPKSPESAVIYRGFTWIYLFALLPLVFVALGAGGMAWALGKRKAKRQQGLAPVLTPGGEPSESLAGFREVDEWSVPVVTSGPVELEESLSPVAKLVLGTIVALFWNGIVSVFLWQLWQSWRAGQGIDGCMAVFLLPFVLIGLLLLLGIPYSFLALANPRPKLTLSRAAIPLGGTAQLQWRFSGSAERLESMRIFLEGVEKATYRRGTDTHTDTEVFATLELVERQRGMPMSSGSATIEIPADTMHSFDGGRNEIAWKLKLKGSIRFWPDVTSEFPFVVEPGEEEES
jgi:hypothetical protein